MVTGSEDALVLIRCPEDNRLRLEFGASPAPLDFFESNDETTEYTVYANDITMRIVPILAPIQANIGTRMATQPP